MPFGGALVAGIGSIFGGLLGGSAASKAAKQQQQAEQQGINTIQTGEDQSIARLNPYLSSGSQASGILSGMLKTPGEGLLTPWTQQFQAPTAAQAEQTPGYQFQLQQGENALQNSAAARGGLLSGRTLADLNTYAQGTASTNYQNTFNNALTQYQSAYNTFQNNQNNTYNRLAGQQGVGLNAANTAGQITSNASGDIASLLAAQGKAAAGGTVGQANAWSGAIPGIGGALTGGYNFLKNLNPFGGGNGGTMGDVPSPYDPSQAGAMAFA